MLEIRKESLGYFVAYFWNKKTEFTIQIASNRNGTKGNSFYDVYKNDIPLNRETLKLNDAKSFLKKEFTLNQQ